ncbi:MAG: hypothetical protein QM496_01895 [Verrucomicrobiota bacterium]
MAGLVPEATFGDGEYLIDSIGIDEWNRVVDQLTRSRPLRVTVVESDQFRHPWMMTLGWNVEEGRWGAQVDAGFVNEEEVVIRVATKAAPSWTVERLAAEVSEGAEWLDAWLSENPVLPVANDRWRAVGYDASEFGEAEAVPGYFLELGVEDRRGSTELDGVGAVTRFSGALPDPDEVRLLRAVDVVLVQPRPALTVDWVGAGNKVDFQLGVRMPARDQASLKVVRKYIPPDPLELDGLGILGGEDPGLDERWLATLYLVSPVGAVKGSEPDESWTPYVSQRVFWHLRYGVDQDLEAVQSRSLSFDVPLAGGVGNLAVQGFLDENNAASFQAEALLNQSRIRGQFWT